MFTISRLSSLVKLLPREVFAQAVQRHEADRYRKTLSCWQQLVVMVCGQLLNTSSLRTLTGAFNAQATQHYHLRCQALRRSTLSDANTKASAAAVYEEVLQSLLARARGRVRKEGTALLRLLDSSSITLKGAGFDEWTRATRTCHTQGVKLHLLYEPQSATPLSAGITAANLNDVEFGRKLALERGRIYVFDKAFCDYSWWWRIEQAGARFVTRLKSNARTTRVARRHIARTARGIILKDETVYLSNKNPGGGRTNPYSKPLRRIEVARPAPHDPLVLVSNDLKSSALTIAERYKARWQIELFFKWIKQHLRIKSFLGRTETAVRIQIFTALIAYLLVGLYARLHRVRTSLWLLLSELRTSLFQRADTERERLRRWRQHRHRLDLVQPSLFT